MFVSKDLSSATALVIADEQGVILFVNAETRQLFGYEHEQLHRQNIEILVPERLWLTLREQRATYVGNPLAWSMGLRLELYGLRRDGAEFPAEITFSALKTAAGVLFTTAIRDVTNTQKANELQACLAALVNSAGDAMLSEDTDGVILMCNPAAEQLFGYSAQEIVGRPNSLLIPPERSGEALDLLRRALQGETVAGLETERLGKSGQLVHVSLTVSPIRDAESRIIGASQVARDITDRKRTEAALQRVNKDLSQFAYAAAHDLQEPLRNVSLSLSLLKSPPPGIDIQSVMNEGMSSAQHMLLMVKGLLAFSKVADDIKPENAPVDAEQILRQVLTAASPLISQTGARITSEALPMVRMETALLFALLDNLIGNALKYRHPARTPVIQVSAVQQAKAWIFAVADNGIGFQSVYAEHIFGLFKRLHKNDEYPGTGIGLAICARIVAAHGGRIWAEGEPENGAVFRFTLPADSCAWKQPAAKPATKILVVEDNPVDVWMLRDALQREKIWPTEIAVVTDGEAAIHYLRRQSSFANVVKPDLVILDLNLPKRDGTEVLQVIRSTEELKGLPVIVFSSSPQDVVQERIQNANVAADHYVTKPTDAKDLHVLGEVLRRSFQETQTALLPSQV